MEISDAHQPFLDAILADPDDVVPYGIYADWLVEHGDPLGEFIHVQLHLEDESLSGVERMRLKSRESQLLNLHQAQWLGPLYGHLAKSKYGTLGDQPEKYQYGFAKGFLDFVHIPVLLPKFSAALKASPQAMFLRRMTIKEIPAASGIPPFTMPSPEDADERPGLTELRGAAFPSLQRLEIRSETPWVSVRGLEHAMEVMPRLEHLYLEVSEANTPAIFRLQFPCLRELTLNYVVSYDLETLATNPSLGKLVRICFYPQHSWNKEGLSLEGFQAICRSGTLTSLTDLSLYHSNLGDAGIAELTKSPLLRQLQRLELAYGDITDTGAHALADALIGLDQLGERRLKHLVLDYNQLTDSGKDALAKTGVELSAEPQSNDEDDYWYFADWDME